ncbi:MULTISPECIES: hypothetical protein [Providencia]|uniref:hypothetical protein n=1 Tax=Providencia TaxID=586 RepID=UPI00155E6790|nr:hypothetical protein [Providencia rettgeri]MBQ0369047.1 hypothetical protein [Providencia rettgeri]QKG45737.1 hypothetical protein HRD55_14640 [Providencia rettgeri]QNN31974.1 hypothetical protein H9X60_14640 [Providencia rettgeri]QNP19303.1 hypothetical protein H9L31_15605 [Providencia rettgeri]UPS62904.1 hypothetical protein M0M83_20340 [Providencia rettgeri]
MTEATNYWLAGASWDGCDHQDKTFIENKIWVLGYKKNEDEAQYQRAKKIKKNDRIAIKRMMGKGASEIKILHIGVVEGVVDYGNLVICVVNWLVTNKDITVESKGCFASIHGPYEMGNNIETDNWLNSIFSL